MPQPFAAFYRGKRVLVTGHTGFTGGWLVAWLKLLGARVCGYGLPPSSRPNFFDATLLDRGITSIFADVRDRDTLANTLADSQPEIIFHAAQAMSGGQDPVDLFGTNVMGTINLLEEARLTGCVRAMIVVSDSQAPDLLSRASHAAVEQAAFAFAESFFSKSRTGVAVALPPTLIGGGDWGQAGLVPALLRSLISGEPIEIRDAIVHRAHVLEAARACLQLGENLYASGPAGSSCDFVPADGEVISESEFAKKFLKRWGGKDVQIELLKPDSAAPFRSVNNKSECPRSPASLSLDDAIGRTVDWYKAYSTDSSSAWRTTEAQIEQYAKLPIR